ncbi:MAG: hypothetical protein HYR88_14780 [Verrucomicrobia bacterium]|nr:hypothetical protein [Verrucomicrobiota bacterium]MBI3868412.1 hypothetical protein [Verrucomicrobiota bacterium]
MTVGRSAPAVAALSPRPASGRIADEAARETLTKDAKEAGQKTGASTSSIHSHFAFLACFAGNLIPDPDGPHDAVLTKWKLGHRQDWKHHIGHPVLFAESFVDPQRYRGA